MTESGESLGKIVKSDDEWRAQLSPAAFAVARKKGTEAPFSGDYNDCQTAGEYLCVCCDLPLFRSRDKFDSGTGWPSFHSPLAPQNLREESDYKLLRRRTEVLCARCDAHLGHVFPDGPRPTGLRYCMNSVALKLRPADSPPSPANE